MTAPIFLGVDGGGTSTTAWLADEGGKTLGRGIGGPSNAKAIGPAAARQGLEDSINSAFADAGLEIRPVEVACLGLAGFDRPEDKRWLEAWAAGSGWNGRLILANDGDLVVAAGTPEGWGVGLIAGTGSIAVGRSFDGRSARSGGWGHLFGDEGSAYAVALAGLRKIARKVDGREESRPPALGQRLCESLGIASTADLVLAIYREGIDRARIAALAPSVVAAADQDPSVITEILEPAGRELGEMVVSVARQLGITAGPLPLALAGSFLLRCRVVSRSMLDHVSVCNYEITASTVPDPVQGALVLARRGWIRS